MVRLSGALMRQRFVLQAGFDAGAWVAGLLVSTLLADEFRWVEVSPLGLALVSALACVLHVGVGRARGLYIHRWRFGTLEEVSNCAIAVALVSVILAGVNGLLRNNALPVGVILVAPMVASSVMGAGRCAFRLVVERRRRPAFGIGEPILVFGAGHAAERAIHSLLGSPTSPYEPVALVDGDERRLALRRPEPVRSGEEIGRLRLREELLDASGCPS